MIYPCGDQSKLSVAEICCGMECEESEYAIASSKRFDSWGDATGHVRTLAGRHGLRLDGIPNLLD